MTNYSTISVDSQMLSPDIVRAKIQAGEFMTIAADESVLKQLPAGNWIGGTMPYFMSEQGGKISRDSIFLSPPFPVCCRTTHRALTSTATTP